MILTSAYLSEAGFLQTNNKPGLRKWLTGMNPARNTIQMSLKENVVLNHDLLFKSA